MCSGTYESQRGMVKLNPQGSTLLFPQQKVIFAAINSTDSGADFRPRVLYLHVLFTPHLPTIQSSNREEGIMSSSLRGNTMSEAADNWLRRFVYNHRREESSDKQTLNAQQALNSRHFIDSNPCHVYWQGQFQVIEQSKRKKPDDHRNILGIWVKTVDKLHSLHHDDEPAHIDEWIAHTYYRLFRCYNECQEQFMLKGLDGKTQPALHRSAVLQDLKEMMDEEVPKFQAWRVKLNPEQCPSDEYHKLRFEDATWEEEEGFDGLYNKEPRKYTDLMNNEQRLYQSKHGEEPFDVSSLEGNTLITFFTDDLNFWATALLDRLEAIAPVSLQTDCVEERMKKESGYLESWDCTRRAEVEHGVAQNFQEYRTQVQKFSTLMELLYDLKDKPELNKKNRPVRLREYAELAYLHCIIAALPNGWKMWNERLNHDGTPHPPWSLLRTSSNNARTFLESSAENRYAELILEGKDLGYALASVVRWLAHRTNGFYIALASNVQEGKLITNKTRRKATSSSWGEKVVIKHETFYHQFISSSMSGMSAQALKKGLDGANQYFNGSNQDLKEIEINSVCFDVLHTISPQIHGQLLSEEWERAWKDKNMGALVKLFGAIVDFFLRHVDSPPQKGLNDSVCLPRLDSKKEYKSRLMKAQGFDENPKVPLYLTKWIHGDEWGENFTLVHNATETRLYGIDLEDGLKRGSFDSKTNTYSVVPNGGFHAQRLYSLNITDGFEQGVPMGAFNGLSAVGRLLAALVQKSNSKAKTDAPENIQTLRKIMKVYQEESKKANSILLEKEAYHVVWLSFFDWLLHWTTKLDTDGFEKFDPDSFDAHLNAFVNNSDA